MDLNDIGKCVVETWLNIGDLTDNLIIDCHVVMPNHFHATFGLTTCLTQTNIPASQQDKASVSSIVRRLKTFTTKRFRLLRPYTYNDQDHLWQRGYWDHIIRNDQNLQVHREYILNNPLKWQLDKLYKP